MTIAICTLNRAESLRRTLDSLAAMRVPKDLDWEVVVVNNNCADHTDAVIAGFATRLPIRREFEAQRGLSRARNRAIEAARGDYIVWTDDDVVVDPGWLAAYAEAFQRWPEAAVFAGPIVPRYAPPVPKWIAESAAILGPTVFAGCNLGDQALPLSIAEGRMPYGPNFAFRSVEQRRFRYDPDLGHGPTQRRRGEEVDVIERAMQAGATGYWVPRARLEHCSDAGQQTIRYVARYFAIAGETDAYLLGHGGAPLWFGAPRWQWRRLIEGWVGYHVHRLISPAPVWVKHFKDYNNARGAIRYWHSQRR